MTMQDHASGISDEHRTNNGKQESAASVLDRTDNGRKPEPAEKPKPKEPNFDYANHIMKDFGFDRDDKDGSDYLRDYLAYYKAGLAKRGLLILGDVGRGKTYALQMVSKHFGIPFFSASQVVIEAANDKKVIENVAKHTVEDWRDGLISLNPRTGRVSRRYCDIILDDIGKETAIVNNYGTKFDPIRIILEIRGDIFEEFGYRTFFSSNLLMEDILSRYGKRVDSRISGMSNPVTFTGPDRRQVSKDGF